MRKLSLGIQRERSPERIAPERPRESWPLALSRSTVPGDESRAQKRICHHPLQQAHPRPVVSLLNLRVRQIQAQRPRRSEEHTSELQSQSNLVCRLLLEKKKTVRRHPRDDDHRN